MGPGAGASSLLGGDRSWGGWFQGLVGPRAGIGLLVGRARSYSYCQPISG